MEGEASPPQPGRSIRWGKGRLLRVELLKWWIVETSTQGLEGIESSGVGVVLDLSYSRTGIRIAGPGAADLVNRYLAVDLSGRHFPEGAVATGKFDHISGTVMRHGERKSAAFDLYVPRSFAASFWPELVETATQFGVEIE